MAFINSQYLWLLTAIPVVLALWSLGMWHHRRMRARFGDLEGLTDISRISWSGRGWLRGGLFAASLTAMIVGLARPQMPDRDVRVVPKPTDVVFMLDTSPSMFATDMDPNRIGRAEQIIQQFILHKLPEDRYGLVGFNANGTILSFLTRDPQGILPYFEYLNRTTEPGLGTNMGAAMVAALRVFDSHEQLVPADKERRRVLVLLSDGDDTMDEWDEPARDVISRQVKLYTFGLGSATGAVFPLRRSPQGQVRQYALSSSGQRLRSVAQASTLQMLADRTGARFYRGEDDRQVQAAINDVLVAGRPVAGYQSYPIRRDLYFHFFVAAFVCMLAATFL